MNNKKVLIIDDDTRLRNLLGKFLGENNFETKLASQAQEARQIIENENDFDLLIADVMMPDESGIEFTKKFKQNNQTPILILTARGEPDDRIQGLEAGADDYLAKPFEPKELLLRINNILKHQPKNKPESPAKNCNFGEFNFDQEKIVLRKCEKFIHLTDGEKKILAALCKNKNQLLAREKLAEICGNVDVRSVDVQITRLRRKIEANPKQPEFLQTVRNGGYILRS